MRRSAEPLQLNSKQQLQQHGRWTEGEIEYEEASSPLGVDSEALDGHRQVLQMAETIAVLTRDFETQQQELMDAYRRLHAYESASESPMPMRSRIPQGHSDGSLSRCGCAHEREAEELRRLIDIKDLALTDALQQRNEYRMQLEQAESQIRTLRVDAGSSSRDGRWKVHPHASNMGHLHLTGAMSSTHSTLIPSSSSSSSFSMGSGPIDVPRHERFDHESSYHQSREDDDLFWRKQYKEAVHMRKKYGLVSSSGPPPGKTSSSSTRQPKQQQPPRASLKIFSYPQHNRRQKGIADESVPFSRYIGISARQHAIITEQHQMLS